TSELKKHTSNSTHTESERYTHIACRQSAVAKPEKRNADHRPDTYGEPHDRAPQLVGCTGHTCICRCVGLTRRPHCLDVTEVALFNPHATAVGSHAPAEARTDGQPQP